MAHVQKRNGKWQARYRALDGREHAKRFSRRVDAERWLAEQKVAVDRGQWIDPSLGRKPFAEWVSTYVDTTVSNRASTRARDASYLRTHILPTFGPLPLAAIDHAMVQAWVAQLTAKGKAPATVGKAFQILSKAMSAAVRSKLIVSNPCVGVQLPRVEREEMRFLNPEEVARLADAIHPRYRALVLLGCWGGLRIGEMAGLKRTKVDPLRRRVEVAEVLVEVQGHLVWGQPKTRAGRRSVTIPASVMGALVEHMERWSGEELVFTSPEGGPLRVNAWRRRHWNPAVEAAGLPPLRPHDMRHSAVALWIAGGARPLEVTRRAGHTSTSFTQDRYGHLFPEDEDALAVRLEALVVSTTVDAEVLPIR